jgi:hypothetical protein
MAVARGLTLLRRGAAFGVAVSLTLPACTSSSPPRAAAAPAAPPAPPADPAYDWRGLLMAPFGTALKDMPVALHEVLLFRDEEHAADGAEEPDCHATNGPTPRFAGQTLDEYLLCFEHDRLHRVEATIRLAADQAAQVLSRACAQWLGNAAPAEAPDSGCSGVEGGVSFAARLGPESDESGTPLTITLESAATLDSAQSIP